MARKKGSGRSPETRVPEDAVPGVNPVPGTEPGGSMLAYPVVGIGASAGGLAAISQLLHALPKDTGMAFVVVQHLDPTHQSMLAEILARSTALPVETAQDQQQIQPDHVYVIPPGRNLVIGDGRLNLSPRTETRGQHRSIDLFLRSLAEHQAYRAIGVVLSGSSSDGTLGIEEIKAAGGITFAQDDTAEHTHMPRSAIAAGCVDFVLAPADIAAELKRIARHPLVASRTYQSGQSERLFDRVLEILRHTTGVDFANYKRNTLERRITRRMLLHRFDVLEDYVSYLLDTPTEVEALYQDVLISVTSFFRDPEAYEVIKSRVFTRLTENKSRHEQVRIWALGCSTGEEAYSLAMAYTEFAENSGRRIPLQIFATDLNGAGIQKARVGIYAKGIAQDLSPERLRRFFVEVDGSYRISKPIRDMCVFARQNVLADPPFSRMDLIACRNMLIYLQPVLQQKLLPILHYSLQPEGFLWLGSSETIGNFRDLFDLEDSRNKVYAKKNGLARVSVRIPHHVVAPALPRLERRADASIGPGDPQREADRVLLARYAPAGVVVNADLEIVQFRGETSPYLAPAPGRATLSLPKMLREGLTVAVLGAAQRAATEKDVVRLNGLRVKGDAGYRDVEICVTPLRGTALEGFLLVTFEPPAPTDKGAPSAADGGNGGAPRDGDDAQKEVARVRQELESTRDYLQSLIEQRESVNEELQSANEEVQSTNEELQSINEELETSKEEIQSSNEELATVNEELQKANVDLSRSNDDLLNLLSSVDMAIVMLGRDLRIRRFTAPAGRLLNLIPADVGRPIGDLKLGLSVTDLAPLVAEVVATVSMKEQLVTDRRERWYLLRVQPYRTLEKQIDGAVLVLVDVDQLKHAQLALTESENRFVQLADIAPVLIWVNGPEGRRYVNKAYVEFVGEPREKLQGDDWTRFIHPADRESYLGSFREHELRREPFQGQFRLRRADGQYRWMQTLGVPRFIGGEYAGYIGYKVDISDMKSAEETLREADRSKDNFLAMLAHELRTPLAAVRNAVQVLSHERGSAEMATRAKAVIERQTVHMVRIVDDLLDLSRLTRGTLRLRKHRVNLLDALRQAIDATAFHREACSQQLQLSAPQTPLLVDADVTRLQQIFTNLFTNAARYTGQGGHVWVDVAVEAGAAGAEPGDAGWIVVKVRDDGIGIDAEMLPHLFDMFSRVKNVGQNTGLGIGLNLARRLAQLQGGDIVATSGGRGHGSEFIVRLPLQHDVPQTAAESAAQAPKAAGEDASRLRVLVVEDDADAADMLRNLLQLARQDVRCVNDGEAALRVAAEFRPDLALLDISMPGMDGRELARRLRENPQTSATYIVAVTGFSPKDAQLDMSQRGFDERVTKPLEYEALLALLARVRAN